MARRDRRPPSPAPGPSVHAVRDGEVTSQCDTSAGIYAAHYRDHFQLRNGYKKRMSQWECGLSESTHRKQVRGAIETVAAEYSAEEALVVNIMYDHQARRRSYERIAETFGLRG